MQPTKIAATTDASRPFRLGLWLVYGHTLAPDEGIGVFVHNLIAGLLELEEPLELVLLTQMQEQHVVEYLRQRAPDRVKVLPDPSWQPRFGLRLDYFLYLWRRGRASVACWERSIRSWRNARVKTERARILALARTAFHASFLAFFGLGLAVALLALIFWPLWAVGTLLIAAARAAFFPLRLLAWVADEAGRRSRFTTLPASSEIAENANCDLWVIPYVGHEYPLSFPAVVFVHDLVVAHYPEHFNTYFAARLKTIVAKRVREAIYCCCMSDFIRGNDLLGVLGLSPERVKMVRPAAPTDFPHVSPVDVPKHLPRAFQRPYLFYPAAFRGYKNHRVLIETLRCLRDKFGEDRFDVVFTGAASPVPTELEALAAAYGLQTRVQILGRVSREVLAALYQRAFATIVPSLYEQGSFPIYEALHYGCPAACSDIPALREQCAALGDAMVYFDPKSPESTARAVLRIRDDRESIRDEQRRRGAAEASRTWKQVAREWLPIFREAAASARAHCTVVGRAA